MLMKGVFFLLIFCSTLFGAPTKQGSLEPPLMGHQIWDALLKKNVSADGKVNYQGFIEDRETLNAYLEVLKGVHPNAKWSRDEEMAYWINAYNAFTVQLIVDHYPVESIKDLGGNLFRINTPWDIQFIEIEGVHYDLNDIEHNILRDRFKDPRIHFAINCASISCPKLRNEAYTATALERQLDAQARDFLNNPEKNIITANRAQLSSIFSWFQSDFVSDEKSLVDFINRYAENPLQRYEAIEFLDYNWNLNE